jgi:hypothetical protein
MIMAAAAFTTTAQMFAFVVVVTIRAIVWRSGFDRLVLQGQRRRIHDLEWSAQSLSSIG